MPRTPTSIKFDFLHQQLPAAVAFVRAAFGEVDFMKPSPHYTLLQWDEDLRVTPRVFRNQPAGPLLPAIKEPPDTFNGVSYSLFSDARDGSIVESLLSLRTVREETEVVLLYNGNIVRSLGSHWIVKTIDTLLPKLRADCGCFCDESDESEMSRRLSDGESLVSITVARVTGRDKLPPPLLAVIRSELCEEQVLAEARDRGVTVRMTLRGNVTFATLDL